MEALLGLIFMTSLIVGIIFAFINRSIAKGKGYKGRRAFVGGLFLNIRSTIYCLTKDKTPQKKAEEYKQMQEIVKG